jgi:hypothetical protein
MIKVEDFFKEDNVNITYLVKYGGSTAFLTLSDYYSPTSGGINLTTDPPEKLWNNNRYGVKTLEERKNRSIESILNDCTLVSGWYNGEEYLNGVVLN